jgi:hypothetical protein
MAMALLWTILLVSAPPSYCASKSHAQSAGTVDFCNHEYARVRTPFASQYNMLIPKKFRLKQGVYQEKDGGGMVTLDEVSYADVTHDGTKEAILEMTYHTGGSMQLRLVYIWSLNPSPVLLWAFAAGDRSDHGLHGVYAKDGDLIVELNDPAAMRGSCCSLRFIRTRYRWNGSKFVQQGKPRALPNHEYDPLKD